MKTIFKAAAVAAILVSYMSAAPAFAQATAEQIQKFTDRFNAADKDHDGKLTLAEAKDGMPMVARNFDKIDTEHTGAITLQQIAAFIQKQKEQKGG